ncbi:IclR family transcriptional regulator [Rhodococcus erythropolis]|uniref:IclR family transcriptional regulator n=1 Tax=Rhodococcus erythropolis TaxID=1833 RepID=UPI002948E163|nr:IclR family transcriptional regulator [Rhodococcus erythropolis]MDV6212761.1 IclR family transcriptional regulator [Rhodococcus erythropolis]
MGAEEGGQVSGAIQSVLNALKILESIGSQQPVGVSELARHVKLPKSSVQRALRTLDHAGWIHPVEGDQTRWELTSWMLAISLKAFGEYSLRDYAEPAMNELRRRTGETIHLVSLDGDSALVIHRLDSSQPVRAFVQVGSRSPLHATASGQAILAFLPDARVQKIVSGNLEAYTSETVTDVMAITDRLAVVQERGYSVNLGEWRPEVASISAPILSVDGQAIAAMTISIPITRYSPGIVDTYGGWVRELTQNLTGLGQEAKQRTVP